MKLSRNVMGAGAIAVGILIAITEYMSLPGYLNYLWAVLALIWGILWLTQK